MSLAVVKQTVWPRTTASCAMLRISIVTASPSNE
jgi:hypothetical protein